MFTCKLFYHVQNIFRELRIKCRCRFIKEKYLRIKCKCSRNRYTLLLSSGKLTRIRIFLIRKSKLFEQITRTLLCIFQGNLLNMNRCIDYILHYRIMRKEIKILKHKSKVIVNFFKFILRGVYALSFFIATYCLTHIRHIPAIYIFQQCRASEQC